MDVKDFTQKIYDKQEEISKEISEINVTLAKQHENLQFHMYRTELNERSLDSLQKHQDEVIVRLEASLKEALEKIENRVQPIETHVRVLNGILKLFGALSALSSAAYGIFKLVSLLL